MIYLTYRLIRGTRLTFKYGFKMMSLPINITRFILK